MARKFLYFVAACIVLVIGVLAILRIWSDELSEIAFVPQTDFAGQAPLAPGQYDDPAMWLSRPGTRTKDAARWEPSYAKDSPAPPAVSALPTPPFAVFFVHPTSYLDRASWNAPLDDAEALKRARLFVRGMATPFGKATEIWAPRYRQATIGAFMTEKPDANRAIDAAYKDVALAFDRFVAGAAPDLPIVLVGHSQGAAHVLRLLREKVAGQPIRSRIAAVYAPGWPISVTHDLPYLGLPACAAPNEAGCILSWSSYAEPADAGHRLSLYARSTGFDGKKRGKAPILCVNPLTGSRGDKADLRANLGTLRPSADLASGELVAAAVPARCDERGILLIGDPPEMGAYVLPGNDYHVYDIPLFWANLRADVSRRVIAWQQAR